MLAQRLQLCRKLENKKTAVYKQTQLFHWRTSAMQARYKMAQNDRGKIGKVQIRALVFVRRPQLCSKFERLEKCIWKPRENASDTSICGCATKRAGTLEKKK